MPMAIGNPDEIMDFSNTLEAYLDTITQETDRLNSAFQQLGDSWQDQQRKSFEETYQQLQGALSSFKENASNQKIVLVINILQLLHLFFRFKL